MIEQWRLSGNGSLILVLRLNSSSYQSPWIQQLPSHVLIQISPLSLSTKSPQGSRVKTEYHLRVKDGVAMDHSVSRLLTSQVDRI